MTTLFVGNLPFDAKDEDISGLFAPYDCTSAAMQYYDDSKRSKGFALVTVNDGPGAISNLHDTEFQGRKMIVREDRGPGRKKERPPRRSGGGGGGGAPQDGAPAAPPAPCDTIYVSNLPWSVDSEELGTRFPGHSKCEVVTGWDGRSRGYGLVTYGSADAAQKAIDEMNGTDVGGRNIVVRFDNRGS
mmetsp:Transcript_17879/g.33253  ORF Transcript_17879/g.33253 Transcript_17879/m.33253 type:complete len:187 (-) Transcript_17879:203-763(-)|eukprot:CAMPEP_0197433594 /NCGR_PEP_ID=MMETSP1175-20131217/1455_1 /TAXON_ID=1003142 /ORGANISM="Triceratium dubium, Strain CCMP147" /LENGTH=186 /DNA_ID=CAMNT_0042962027 /DNA_START=97 /DNA_END=657 /DNA_ORIENTATION=+